MYFGSAPSGSMNLQANLSAMTSVTPTMVPHHPITCATGGLAIHDDGSMECDHVRTGEADERTQAALDATASILLFELVFEKYGSTPRSS